jgi:hypothetical protein
MQSCHAAVGAARLRQCWRRQEAENCESSCSRAVWSLTALPRSRRGTLPCYNPAPRPAHTCKPQVLALCKAGAWPARPMSTGGAAVRFTLVQNRPVPLTQAPGAQRSRPTHERYSINRNPAMGSGRSNAWRAASGWGLRAARRQARSCCGRAAPSETRALRRRSKRTARRTPQASAARWDASLRQLRVWQGAICPRRQRVRPLAPPSAHPTAWLGRPG